MKQKREKRVKRLKQLIEVLKTVLRRKGMKWDDLTKKQKDAFEDEGIRKLFGSLMAKKCWFCKKRYDRPLFSQDYGMNGEFAFHLKSTHGYDMEIIIEIIRRLI